MPTCVGCGKWRPPSEGLVACPSCRSELGSGDALRRAEAKAATLGVTLDEYLQREKDEREARWAEQRAAERAVDEARSDDEREAKAAREGTYITTSDDAFSELGLYVFSLTVAIATGAVLVVVSLLVGRSPLGAVGGTAVAVVGGALLVPPLYYGSIRILATAARRGAGHRWARHAAYGAHVATLFILFLLPSLLTVIGSMLLW